MPYAQRSTKMRTMRRIQHIIRYYEQIILCNFRASTALEQGVTYVVAYWRTSGVLHRCQFFPSPIAYQPTPNSFPVSSPPATDTIRLPPIRKSVMSTRFNNKNIVYFLFRLRASLRSSLIDQRTAASGFQPVLSLKLL